MSEPAPETATAVPSTAEPPTAPPAAAAGGGLDHGTYEVLRARLAGHAAELARRAADLNARRLEVFGGTEPRLLGTERIRTGDDRVPRDVVAVGGLLLFGHNGAAGTGGGGPAAAGDVLALHRVARDGDDVSIVPAGDAALPALLQDERFGRDFAEMYRYYRQARLLRLRVGDGRLLAVFQTGPRLDDVRVLRWEIGTGADPGAVRYLDNRGERDHVRPPSHDFAWTETTRADHVPGRHPKISIGGEVFVDTLGGTLSITAGDAEVHSEPVDEPLQSLADAGVHHARVGALVLLRVRPYNETAWRHLVFNTRTGTVTRLDGIERACRRLPGDAGIVFPGGYYLDTGAVKTFDTDVTGLEYERVVRSPNGEDVLYVFRAPGDGRTLLLHYNVIRKEVAAPVVCQGHALFEDGTLVVLRETGGEAARVHPVQVWASPYMSDAYAAARPAGTGPLDRVGNADLVRGISDCLSITRMVEEMSASAAVFEALIAACVRAADFHHWLGEDELGDLLAPLADVRTAAEQVLAEYENVQELTRRAAAAVDEADTAVTSLIRLGESEEPATADAWMARLAELRRARGHLESLRGTRFADGARIDALAAALAAEQDAAGHRTVAFLRGAGAFDGYHAEIERLDAEAAAIGTAAEAGPVAGRLTAQTEGLEIVTEVVGGLDIADATVRTEILERVGEALGGVNRARAVLDGRRRELLDAEGRAAFAAESALLDQAVAGALALAGTPERCDEQLGRLLLRLEGLEARFAEFDDFLARLETRRADVYEAFSARRQALLDERARRAERLAGSAGRILAGVRRRAAALDSLDDVNTYFGTDAMVERLRAVAAELRELGDVARAEELDGGLKAARQEAGRALRDRDDLYAGGGELIRLGRHRFAVNTRPAELTLVPHEGALAFAVTGTDYRAPVRDAAFLETRPFWDQLLVSETADVYRAEYLAASLLPGAPSGDLLGYVRHAAGERFDEGYERGVHDHDAALILRALRDLSADAGLLRYPPAARAAAQLYWTHGLDTPARAALATRAASLARARAAFGTARPASHSPAPRSPDGGHAPGSLDEGRAFGGLRTGGAGGAGAEMGAELDAAIGAFCDANGLPAAGGLAGEYLFEELASGEGGFVSGALARGLLQDFRAEIGSAAAGLERDLAALPGLPERYQLARAWLDAYRPGDPDQAEAVAALLCDAPRRDSPAALTATVGGLLGAHPRLTGRELDVRLDETLARVRRFEAERVPAYRAYQHRRTELIATERKRLRLDEHRPAVLGSFVRNGLLDEIYLPLIGDNLAKQLGTAAGGTDRMGLLLLISPPGYGKTTLVEYVADRLGLLLVKVDGPALGHGVTSLDPAEAPNATARQEVEKINLALELGGNVLLYLDDIQHTSPELLQKFIPLCDAQRRIDGVRDGEPRSYDLRGKRFAVCMAGNPYTESGARFQLPDMLANRADVWNLGDVLSGRDDLFALSYIENALTSNPVLAPLSARGRADTELLVRLAEGDGTVRPDRLAHPYTQVELDEILAVLRNLLRARDTVLAVNRAYIASAARSDAARTEPPFRLQGSYRNLNKIAARLLPVHTAAELEDVIDDHYAGEAQTLTSDAEANLLKLAEIRGRLTPEQAARWSEVKAAHARALALGGGTGDTGEPGDPVTRAVGALGHLADRVTAVETAINRATHHLATRPNGVHRPREPHAPGE
ncbi:DNA repair ATPase [Actinomadura sp. 21ATH]|uniref:DNA repair ATPase n=1 Tax=Actinomadura sp. 21ATH TaxID=1735444 RepID=UPI0035C2538F